MYIYIYVYVCVCMCARQWIKETWNTKCLDSNTYDNIYLQINMHLAEIHQE